MINGTMGGVDPLFVDSAPAFDHVPEFTSEPDQENGPHDDWEVPGSPAQTENFGVEECDVGEDFEFDGGEDSGTSASSQEDSDGEAEDTPSFEEQPAQPQADQKPDFRFADPQSVHDRASIQYALSCTRDDCRARLGVDTMGIPTTPELCYALQWLEIQKRFAERWPLRGEGETPVLFQLQAWTDNFDN